MPKSEEFKPDSIEFTPDSIVTTITQRFIDRAKFGFNKYGTDLDRTDLSTSEWIKHMQDELHDAYLYSEKLLQNERKTERLLYLALKWIHVDDISEDAEALEFRELKKWYATW